MKAQTTIWQHAVQIILSPARQHSIVYLPTINKGQEDYSCDDTFPEL